jgi:hypothetical protein
LNLWLRALNRHRRRQFRAGDRLLGLGFLKRLEGHRERLDLRTNERLLECARLRRHRGEFRTHRRRYRLARSWRRQRLFRLHDLYVQDGLRLRNRRAKSRHESDQRRMHDYRQRKRDLERPGTVPIAQGVWQQKRPVERSFGH